MLLEIGGRTVLTDPFLRNWLGPLQRQGARPPRDLGHGLDLVLISHLHRDHLDYRSLRRLRPRPPAVVPSGAEGLVRRGGIRELHGLRPGERFDADGLKVTAVPAVHRGNRDWNWGRHLESLGYVIEAGGRRVYFAGDTDLFDEMSEIDDIDLALVPVWGWGRTVGRGHLDPQRAAEAVARIRPRLAVPIHWGTLYPLGLRRRHPEFLTDPPRDFAALVAERAPETEARVLEPGASTTLSYPPEP